MKKISRQGTTSDQSKGELLGYTIKDFSFSMTEAFRLNLETNVFNLGIAPELPPLY